MSESMYRTNHAPTPFSFQLPALLLVALTACRPSVPDDGAVPGATASSTITETTESPTSSSASVSNPTTGYFDTSTTNPANPSSSEGADEAGETGESGSTGDYATSEGTSSSSAPGPVCGDGVVEDDETCDDMNDIPDDGCKDCTRDSIIFITSQTYQGNVNGLAGADQRCRMLAAIADLPRFETYRAWLSSSTKSAGERLLHSRGRYVLVNGLVVAQDWDALVSGTLEHPINVDENSQTQAVRAWTSTLASGEAAPGADFCDDWTGVLDFDGGTGLPGATDATWSFFENVPCDVELRLYCLEQ
jgi:cysteine-rich repeat protein